MGHGAMDEGLSPSLVKSRRVVPDRPICYDLIRFEEKYATRGETFGAGVRRALSLAVTAGAGAWLHGRSGSGPELRSIRLSDVVDAVERGRRQRLGR